MLCFFMQKSGKNIFIMYVHCLFLMRPNYPVNRADDNTSTISCFRFPSLRSGSFHHIRIIQKRLENSPTCALLVLHVRILYTTQMMTEETSIPVFKVVQSSEPTEQGSYLYDHIFRFSGLSPTRWYC